MKYEIAVSGAKEAAINLRQMEAAMAGVNKEAAKMGQLRPGKLGPEAQAYFSSLSPANQQRLLASNPSMQGKGGSTIVIPRDPNVGAAMLGMGTVPNTFQSLAAQRSMERIQKANEDRLRREASGMGPLQSNNWKLGAMGIGASMFSPWIGARMLNQAFPGVGNKLGGGGGGGASGIFGAGGMAGFGEWFIALSVASRALKLAFEELMGAVKQGAELYQRSARLGMNAGAVSAMQETFKLLGLSAQMTEKLLAYGQFGKGSKMRPGEFQDAVVGASRGVMGQEEMQAIRNLAVHGELADAYARVADAAAILAKNSENAMTIQMDLGQLKADWEALWSEMMMVATPVMQLLIHSADGLLWGLTKLIEPFDTFTKIMMSFASMITGIPKDVLQKVYDAYFPKGGPGSDFTKSHLGAVGSRPKTSWESMGLIVNGGIAGTDYARQTAANTRKIADLIANILPDGRKKAKPDSFLNSMPNAYNMP